MIRAAIRGLNTAALTELDLTGEAADDPQAATDRVSARLLADVDQLEAAIAGFEHRRDLDRLEVRGAYVYATGGISAGDTPTELAESISRLEAADVLPAAGFES